jgi:AcrR family transcriptional regulator
MKEIVNATQLSKGAFYHYFENKEKVFEEVGRYFYSHIMITDYASFPIGSLKEFYMAYVDALEHSADGLDTAEEANIIVFLSDAARKIPAFAETHSTQHKKGITAWTAIVETAKNNGKIASELPDRTIAAMFLNLSDGIAMNRIFSRGGAEALLHISEVGDGLYELLKKTDKQK